MQVLDDEHEECEAALCALQASPTAENVKAVLEVYSAHFAHEEALLDEHMWSVQLLSYRTLDPSNVLASTHARARAHSQEKECYGTIPPLDGSPQGSSSQASLYPLTRARNVDGPVCMQQACSGKRKVGWRVRC